MNTLIQVKNAKGEITKLEVNAASIETLRKDLRFHNAELSYVQAQRFLNNGVGVHFDFDRKNFSFSVGYMVSRVH